MKICIMLTDQYKSVFSIRKKEKVDKIFKQFDAIPSCVRGTENDSDSNRQTLKKIQYWDERRFQLFS